MLQNPVYPAFFREGGVYRLGYTRKGVRLADTTVVCGFKLNGEYNMEELNYDLFCRVAKAANFSGAFAEALDTGVVKLIETKFGEPQFADVKVFTPTGKVCQRIMPLLIEHVAYVFPANCAIKYSMLGVLLGKAGIPAKGWRWRGKAGEESSQAKEVTRWAMEYLSYKFPNLKFETETAGYTPKVRTDIMADTLSSIVI